MTAAAYERAKVRAPFDGVITSLSLHVGDGVTLGQAVFEMIDDTALHLEVTLDEADIAKVRVRQEAKMSLDALPGVLIPGHVARLDPSVKKDTKGARTLTIEVGVDDLEKARTLGLKAGMSANVEIIVAKKDNTLFVPSRVIVGRGLNRFVYVLKPEGNHLYRVQKTVIVPELSNWDSTEIRQDGTQPVLNAGDWLVASLNEKGLEDGVLVRIQQDSKGAAGGH